MPYASVSFLVLSSTGQGCRPLDHLFLISCSRMGKNSWTSKLRILRTTQALKRQARDAIFASYTSFCNFPNRCCKSDRAIDDRIFFPGCKPDPIGFPGALNMENFAADNLKMLSFRRSNISRAVLSSNRNPCCLQMKVTEWE